MTVNRIKLETRLDRISRGFASDPAYIPHVIRSMADMPIEEYLADFPLEADRMQRILKIYGAKEGMTYREAARLIQEMYSMSEVKQKSACSGAQLLALPLIKCFQERQQRRADGA